MLSTQALDDDRVMSLVQSTLSLDPAQRDAYLKNACAGDAKLFDAVWAYVRAEDRMQGFLLDPLCTAILHEYPFEPGELVCDQFRILSEVGRGGMGVVYKALDEKLHRHVAIKCAQRNFQNLLIPEARAALEVSHPNVCKLHELRTAKTAAGPVDFLTMEYVGGETLKERIDRAGPLPEKEAREIALQICAGLTQVHKQGVIHGDLKAGNVILSESQDGGRRAVITDFGLAKFRHTGVDGAHVMSGQGGTRAYMAPELFEGMRASVASDIYALGVLFQDMLSPLPKPWNRIVKRCLEVSPKERFASVEEVSRIFIGRRVVLQWAMAAALTVIVALGAFLWRSGQETGPAVRLAILPVAVDGAAIPAAGGLAEDVAQRISGARRNFTVIPPGDVRRNKVDILAKAKPVLGATHVLRIHLRNSNGQLTVIAAITDTASGQAVRELRGDYPANDQAMVAKALIATVTGAFGLRAGVVKESVSEPAYRYYAQGIEFLRRDTLSADQAIPYLNKAAELDPRSALPYAALAEARLQKFDRGEGGQWLELAGADVDKSKSINPDSAPVLVISGYVEQKHGRYEQAIAEFLRATDLEPANSEAWRRLAEAYAKTNRPVDAVATYRKAIAAQPEYYKPYAAFGNYYLSRNQFHSAEDLYRRAIELAPAYAFGHMNLGLALMKQGRFRDAENALLESLHLNRTYSVLINLGVLNYEEERYQQALKYFDESREAGAPTLIHYKDLGDTHRHLGHHEKARDAYLAGKKIAQQEVSRNPRDGFAHVLLGQIDAQLGDENADYELDQALALEPENAFVIREAVIGYEVSGHREKSLEVLRKAPTFTLEELNRDPDVKELKHDSQFQAMLQGTAVH